MERITDNKILDKIYRNIMIDIEYSDKRVAWFNYVIGVISIDRLLEISHPNELE